MPDTAERDTKAQDTPGATLIAALAERDFDRLAATLAANVRLRALIPAGPVELGGEQRVGAKFASWFGETEALELVRSVDDEVGDRLHASYRLRVKERGEPWQIVEQHLYYAVDDGLITGIDLICSGFRPELPGMSNEQCTREETS